MPVPYPLIANLRRLTTRIAVVCNHSSSRNYASSRFVDQVIVDEDIPLTITTKSLTAGDELTVEEDRFARRLATRLEEAG